MDRLDDLMQELKQYFHSYILEHIDDLETIEAIQNKKKSIKCIFPDHHDTNPSMMLNKDSVHCFTCGTMNIFQAAHIFEGKPIEGPDFKTENVLYLAEKFGIDTSHYNIGDNEEIKEKAHIRNFFSMMKDYLLRSIDDEHTSLLLQKRNISRRVAKATVIGSIKDYSRFEKYANSRGFRLHDYVKHNITKENLEGKKLIFLLRDNYGNPCGYAAREMTYEEKAARKILEMHVAPKKLKATSKKNLDALVLEAPNLSDEERTFIHKAATIPKYKNSPENASYKKKTILYGIDLVKKALKTFVPLLAVEGYMDAVSGYVNANYNMVSYNSATLTLEQIEELRKVKVVYTIFLPDNDSTGKRKIRDLIKLSKKIEMNHIRIGVFKDPKYKDSDEFFAENPDEDLLDHINVYTVHEMQTLLLIEEEKEIKEIIYDVGQNIAQIQNPIDRKESTQKFFNTLEKNKLTDEVWNFAFVDQTIEYFSKYDKDEMAKRIKKHFQQTMNNIDENPYNAISITERLLDEIKDREKDKLKKKTSAHQEQKNLFKNYREEIKIKREPRTYGMRILDDLRMNKPKNIVIIGKANTGKSIWMINAAIGALKADPNAVIVYFSRDDSYETVVSNFLACLGGFYKSFLEDPYYHPTQGIYSQNRLEVTKRIQSAYQEALATLEKWIDQKRLLITGINQGYRTVGDLEDILKEHDTYKFVKNANKTLFVDSSSKLNSDKKVDKLIKYISNRVKEIGLSYGYTLIQNYEVTKEGLKRGVRVQAYHISDGKEVEYDCDALIRLTSTSHDLDTGGKSVAESTWELNGKKMPILTADFQKNKINGDKNNNYYYKLDGGKSQIHEILVEDDEQYFEEVDRKFFNDTFKYDEHKTYKKRA